MRLNFALISTLITTSILVVTSAQAKTESEKLSFEGEKITDFKLINNQGKLFIQSHDKKSIEVTAKKTWDDGQCQIDVDKSDEEIELKTPNNNEDDCSIQFNVRLPNSTNLTLTTGAGNISVDGEFKQLKFTTGMGDIAINGKIANVDGRSGKGEINAQGKIENMTVRSGMGDVNLKLDEIISEGSVDIRTGKGDTLVQIPEGMLVDAQARSGLGDTYNEVGNTPAAKFKISVKTGLGDLKIKHR